MRAENKKNYKDGLKSGIPIAMGYFAVSFTLGIAARNIGMSAVSATVMSFTNSTSAGEFAALSAIAASASYLEMAVMQFVINLRYMLMSCALSQKIDGSFPIVHRFLMGFGVTDEIFGVSVSRDGKLNPFFTYGAMSLAIPAWSLGTMFGVIMGSVLPANVVSALSVALYGMFLAIIVPPARENKVLAGVVPVSMATSYGFSKIPRLCEISAGTKVIILTVVLAGVCAVLFPVDEEKEDGGHAA